LAIGTLRAASAGASISFAMDYAEHDAARNAAEWNVC
jgi:hypothetical protein